VSKALWQRSTALATALAFAAASSGSPAAMRQASTQTAAAQSRLQIQHDPLACVTTAVAPAVDANVNPGQEVAVSSVLWRAKDTLPYFYRVTMTGTPPSLEGLIPRVEDTTSAVEYYIEASDRAQLSRKTPDYVAPVTPSNVCKAKGVVPPVGGLGLTIAVTDAKAPPVPRGFKKEDIAKVILFSGAVVTLAEAVKMSGGEGAGSGTGAGGATAGGTVAGGAAAGGAAAGAAASGGGISTGVIIGVGVAAAAGIGVAVANSNKSNPTRTPTPTVTPVPPTITPIPLQFVQAQATWSGPGNVDIRIDSQGGSSGTTIPAGCGSTVNRTEQTVLQGASVHTGHYAIKVKANVCEGDTGPATITPLISVRYGLPNAPSNFSGFKDISTNGVEVTVFEFDIH
jgi:hypothetical protein